jgi:cytidyltransferase-like protein
MKRVVVSGSFDDIRCRQVRFLEEASKRGSLEVLLWSDRVAYELEGKPPKFPLDERCYILRAIRYVNQVRVIESHSSLDTLPTPDKVDSTIWVVDEASANTAKRQFCETIGLGYHTIPETQLAGWPVVKSQDILETPNGRKKVIVTGSFDWLHSGHVRFFEEASQLGELYVAVGHDANIRLLKGEGHPLFAQDERRYMVQAIRFVKHALITSGNGWMDAEPEIRVLKPDIYAVNEDGDVPEKRTFCRENRLDYIVLRRIPKEGLPRRQSTNLRGF